MQAHIRLGIVAALARFGRPVADLSRGRRVELVGAAIDLWSSPRGKSDSDRLPISSTVLGCRSLR
jgi:hypothetical protein